MLERNIQMLIRVKKSEQQQIQKRVKESGLSREEYVRSVLLNSVPRPQPHVDYYGFMRELNAIGNCMNQVAARANATGFILADEYADALKRLDDVLLRVQKAITQ